MDDRLAGLGDILADHRSLLHQNFLRGVQVVQTGFQQGDQRSWQFQIFPPPGIQSPWTSPRSFTDDIGINK